MSFHDDAMTKLSIRLSLIGWNRLREWVNKKVVSLRQTKKKRNRSETWAGVPKSMKSSCIERRPPWLVGDPLKSSQWAASSL